MATRTLTFAAACFVLIAVTSGERQLFQAQASAPGTSNKLFDWGRPCTLLGNASQVEITGPGNAACTSCGSGATATPEPTCTFKTLTEPVGYTLSIFYHSSVHHLFLGNAPCTYTTEICPNATATAISPSTPCTYKFATAGSYYISDKAGANGQDNGEYCTDFGATLPITVSTST